MARWSKLQANLYKIMVPEFQIHICVYKLNGIKASRNNQLPRLFITFGKEIIFDYPKYHDKDGYPWNRNISLMSEIIRRYIDCPRDNIFEYHDVYDSFGLVNVLRACDKRIGSRRLSQLSGCGVDNILRMRGCLKPEPKLDGGV